MSFTCRSLGVYRRPDRVVSTAISPPARLPASAQLRSCQRFAALFTQLSKNAWNVTTNINCCMALRARTSRQQRTKTRVAIACGAKASNDDRRVEWVSATVWPDSEVPTCGPASPLTGVDRRADDVRGMAHFDPEPRAPGNWQRIGGASPPRGRTSQPPRPRVMHEVLLARAAVKRSQGRPWAKY